MKNLKDYISDYKQGNYIVLNELIGTTKQEIYKDNKKIYVDRLLFNDKALNAIYWDLNWKYYKLLDSSDFDSYVSRAIFRLNDSNEIESIFDKVDLEKSPQEIVNYVRRKLSGYVYNQGLAEGKIKPRDDKENRKKKNNNPTIETDEYISDLNDGVLDKEVLRKSDKVIFDDYTSIEDDSEPYQEFIKYVGGDVRNLLSDKQRKLYALLQNVSLTQQDIADELEVTQQAVSDMSKAIKRRISKKYFEYMTLIRVRENRNTYRTINGFIQHYETITDYDNDDSFDYFGYVLQFLKSVYRRDEEVLSAKKLHKNKADYTYSIIDVVTDYANINTYKVVEEYIFKKNTNVKLTQRKKDSFVLNVHKAFNKYITDVERAIKGVSEKAAKEGNYEKYIDIFT